MMDVLIVIPGVRSNSERMRGNAQLHGSLCKNKELTQRRYHLNLESLGVLYKVTAVLLTVSIDTLPI